MARAAGRRGLFEVDGVKKGPGARIFQLPDVLHNEEGPAYIAPIGGSSRRLAR